MMRSVLFTIMLCVYLPKVPIAYASEQTTKPPRSGVTDGPINSNADQEKYYINKLRAMNLLLPLEGIAPLEFKGSFYEKRANGLHHAADMLAPRNTPIRAVTDGTVARLFISKAGGITVYELDDNNAFVFYYAHLERYAPDLKEGQRIHRGEIIGFVGTSGNAPPNTPHLHFSIDVLDTDKRLWHTRLPIDPYEVFQYQHSDQGSKKIPENKHQHYVAI